jgi:hypothetical protein
MPFSAEPRYRREDSVEEQKGSDFQQRWTDVFRETKQAFDDISSGRVTVKEFRTKQRELGKRLKALEQELKLVRRGR